MESSICPYKVEAQKYLDLAEHGDPYRDRTVDAQLALTCAVLALLEKLEAER